VAFSRKQDEKLYFAHKSGKWETAFGKKCSNLSLKFGVLSIGEIEHQIFCALPTFHLAKKVW